MSNDPLAGETSTGGTVGKADEKTMEKLQKQQPTPQPTPQPCAVAVESEVVSNTTATGPGPRAPPPQEYRLRRFEEKMEQERIRREHMMQNVKKETRTRTSVRANGSWYCGSSGKVK